MRVLHGRWWWWDGGEMCLRSRCEDQVRREMAATALAVQSGGGAWRGMAAGTVMVAILTGSTR